MTVTMQRNELSPFELHAYISVQAHTKTFFMQIWPGNLYVMGKIAKQYTTLFEVQSIYNLEFSKACIFYYDSFGH